MKEITVILAYEERCQLVQINKNKVFKERLFQVNKKQITDQLRDKLEIVRKDYKHAQIRNRFWVKVIIKATYLRNLKIKFKEAWLKWLDFVKIHLASRRIAIQWRRFIHRKGEV
jgi:hypothetical protein